MSRWSRVRAFVDLRGYSAKDLPADLQAGLAVAVLSVPQGIAYALIAGLPPAMGLYAAAVPAIIGSLFRSSKHVVTGPTNAISLLVGSIIAAQSRDLDPIVVATTLAVVTGLIQAFAGLLRLGTLVDFISTPVVLGYVTGAGVLIAVGQLHNATGSAGEAGSLFKALTTWLDGLESAVDPVSIAIALGTIVVIVGLRRIDRRIPAPVIAVAAGIVLSHFLNIEHTVASIAPVPRGLPPWTAPQWSAVPALLGAAIATAILSAVESSAVARNTAERSGQRLDMNAEFFGQGLANFLGGLAGAFVTSGSLARSELNYQVGARSRLSGLFSGVVMLLVLLVLGPVVNLTPVASLAGLLIVLAADLVSIKRIRQTLRATPGDALAFAVTLLATWTLSLDRAIELGVLVSVVLFLRQARLLRVSELVLDEQGDFHEVELANGSEHRLAAVRILNVEGRLFFGAAGELQRALDEAMRAGARGIVIRLKRTTGLDSTVAQVLSSTSVRLRQADGRLALAGMRPDVMDRLVRTGVRDALGDEYLFATGDDWFAAVGSAVRKVSEDIKPSRETELMMARASNGRHPESDVR